MVGSAPNSPGGAAGRTRRDTGTNLLQELEALSAALYKASQAQNVGSMDGPGEGPSFRIDPGGGSQRRDPLPGRPMNNGSSRVSPLAGNASRGAQSRPSPQIRHSISSGTSAPLYEEHEQDESWNQPKPPRHSIAATRPATLYEDREEELSPLPRGERKIQPWHSQGHEQNLAEVNNFPVWLEDNVKFSKKLEAPIEKKKGIWNWKPFRTLSHIGHTRYNCLFTLHVHAIESLPQPMNGLRLTVHWRHKDRTVQTMPSRVFHSSAEFEETLQLRCSVYSSKGPHHAVKFLPKAFTLSVVALDVQELMLGQHNLDLTRLLPETAEHEYEDEEKPSSWTTSFKLSGKAKGGTLVATFGYEFLQKEKSDRSGRFGSSNGYPSPSVSSPSVRSWSGGSRSTHGTPRPRPPEGNNFYSPALSEPGDYHDYMGMEHLNLDEAPASRKDRRLKPSEFSRTEHPQAQSFPRENPRAKHFELSQPEYTQAQGFPREDPRLKHVNSSQYEAQDLPRGDPRTLKHLNRTQSESLPAQSFPREDPRLKHLNRTQSESLPAQSFPREDPRLKHLNRTQSESLPAQSFPREDPRLKHLDFPQSEYPLAQGFPGEDPRLKHLDFSQSRSPLAQSLPREDPRLKHLDFSQSESPLAQGFPREDPSTLIQLNRFQSESLLAQSLPREDPELERLDLSQSESPLAQGFPREDQIVKHLDLSQSESILAPPTPKQTEEPAEPTKESTADRSSNRDSDEEPEFLVVDTQGVEVGTRPESINYLTRSVEGRESTNAPELVYKDGISAGHRLETRVACTVAETDTARLAVRNVDEIPGTVVLEAEERSGRRELEETGRNGDAVEGVKFFDPLGKLQRVPEGKRRGASRERKLRAPGGRSQEEDQYKEVTQQPREYLGATKVGAPAGWIQEEVQDEEATQQPKSLAETKIQALSEEEEQVSEHPDDTGETKVGVSGGRLQEEGQYEKIQAAQSAPETKLGASGGWTQEEHQNEEVCPLGSNPAHEEYRSDEPAQESVLWEPRSSTPPDEEVEEWDPVRQPGDEHRFGELGQHPNYAEHNSLEPAQERVALWETIPHPPAHEEITNEEQEEEMWRNVNAPDQPLAATAMDDFDDEVDLIAGDFLSMLEGSEKEVVIGMSSESDMDSPRAVLLRQFEHETFLAGGNGLHLGPPDVPELSLDGPGEGMVVSAQGRPAWQSEEDTELASIMEAAEAELQKATQLTRSKTRAKMLEDAETEALMQEWGLNERAFENFPPKPAEGFLGIIGNNQMTKMVPTEPPTLAHGVGPVLQTKDRGMLRSMSPALFSENKANGKLVMQVSKPVVVPSEMGSSGLDIFRRLAAGGVENMALQAMVAMPLEDITGKSVHQIAYESQAALEGPGHHHNYLPSNGYNTGLSVGDARRQHTSSVGLAPKPSSRRSGLSDPSDEFVNLEELAPMAMQKIEALAMDGLKIQADQTDETAPYSVYALPWADAGAPEDSKFRKGDGIGSLDGVAAMHLTAPRRLDGGDTPTMSDGLMSKVISIDEWMRLDAGQYDENDTKDETLAILVAHGAVHKDVVARGSKEDRVRYLQGAKASANFGKGGFMGNTLTIAMLVQLRDPLRNNEPVGAPMMALVQAERVIVPPRPKIPRQLPSLMGNSEKWDDDEEPELPVEPLFKITAVHMAGLKPSEDDQSTDSSKEKGSNKKKAWGNQKQLQSGSRWLAANGMGRSVGMGSKLSALKGNKSQQAGQMMTVKPGESLWSISARVHGTGSKWKDVAALNPAIRNPDVILANQKIRTR